MFLQILGVVFLVVIGVVAYFVWKVYGYVKGGQGSDLSLAMSVLPSQQMELEPSNAEAWREKERLAVIESALKSVGATHVDYYCVYSGYAIIRISLWDYMERAVAVIYEGQSSLDDGNVTFIYEVACKLDIGSLCITSNPHAVYDSRPQQHVIEFMQSRSIVDLLRALKQRIPQDRKVLKIVDPKEFFVKSYEDVSEWAWQPEQLRSQKTRQVLASVGVKVTDELMDELIELGVSYSVEVNVNRARRKLAKHSRMTVERWEKIRHKLVFVNDRMRTHDLIQAVCELAGELTQNQAQVLEGFERNAGELSDPIGAFQMLVQAMQLKVKRVMTMQTPARTEVYLPL
ncbi:MAG: hypothetical protein P8178_10940 [Candidatus Thiodiazotropha sp.]